MRRYTILVIASLIALSACASAPFVGTDSNTSAEDRAVCGSAANIESPTMMINLGKWGGGNHESAVVCKS